MARRLSAVFPGKWIAYVAFLLMFLLIWPKVLAVDWQDPLANKRSNGAPKRHRHSYDYADLRLRSNQACIRVLPGFISGCVIFRVLVCKDTCRSHAGNTLKLRRMDRGVAIQTGYHDSRNHETGESEVARPYGGGVREAGGLSHGEIGRLPSTIA